MDKSDNIKIAAVVMASGHSVRFKGEKLWADINGIPMIEKLFKTIPKGVFERVIVVARDDKILKLAEGYGYRAVKNNDTTNDTAITIRLGTEQCGECDGCAYFVGDQPFLTGETIKKLADFFKENNENICALSFEGKRGNPVIFPRFTFDELKRLSPNEQGKAVIVRYENIVLHYDVCDPSELKDIDYASDLSKVSEKS